ncbi:MAG: YbhB/YbcL family Raf kinase inhibitor-like protein [Candidatus Acidiferrales bacterium]
MKSFSLQSPAFSHGEDIPRKFTCDGPDLSPALNWSEPPAGTRSLALIADDPDAPVGVWVHWVLYDLPPTSRELPEGVAKKESLDDGGRQGRNDFGRIGYGGPCPPPGKAHRYFFKLYALDAPTKLKPGATKAEVEKAMKGHLLAQAELMGRYKR